MLFTRTASLSASSDRSNSSTVVASLRMSVRTLRMTARAFRRLAMEPWLYRPCLLRDARIRSMPAAVSGPVDIPPCIRQRPFLWPPIDGGRRLASWHAARCVSKFPRRPPCLSQPRPARRLRGVQRSFPALPPGPPGPCRDLSDRPATCGACRRFCIQPERQLFRLFVFSANKGRS